MAGVPLLNGFLSKEMFFAETIVFSTARTGNASSCRCAATLASMFSVAYSLRFIHRGVLRSAAEGPAARAARAAALDALAESSLLVLACVVVGIVPALTIGPFLRTATDSVLGAGAPEYSLAVWHGFNLPLVMSAARAGRRRRALPRIALWRTPAKRPPLLDVHRRTAHVRLAAGRP